MDKCENCIHFWNTRKGTICLKKTYRKAIRDGDEYVKPIDCCNEYEKKPVYCKDCKFSSPDDTIYLCGNTLSPLYYCQPNNFCKYGERRTENE